ncbi:hypothetical protein [Actinomadura xylanilytica]|uniref:hypothetical protein n=1 Tax=Actinomadura xylanilytica TaxID=887459 RepID=UPI00255B0ABE|nr:hypothetical protein [Actinomadura xylanilytica]MDL4773769.1 hypothetical protein [Actinomadura xylanilytica]
MTVAAPWAVLELDPDQVMAELHRRFPRVRAAWLGEFTGRWWAVTRDQAGRDLLVEAANPVALARSLDELGAGRSVPHRARAVQTGAAVRRTPPRRRTAAPPGWWRLLGRLVR